jgi:hypothetical protein
LQAALYPLDLSEDPAGVFCLKNNGFLLLNAGEENKPGAF